MRRNPPSQDTLLLASFSAVFLWTLHIVIQLFRIFVTTFMEDRSIIGAAAYDRLIREFLFLTICSVVWTFLQVLPAIWAKKMDATVVICISLLVYSTAIILYVWVFWQAARIGFTHTNVKKDMMHATIAAPSGAGQPAAKSADNVPAKVKPPIQPSKDGPR